ncbi:riboflavin synthase [Microlunatus parietis]|uniref:Riboflavin synthase n=1 Tax=Microlunatus parietis TaxID=682979 RepID=A0A7Y9LDX4_9ACTN|nr:riboflavin synthase [Microlunatus parietis]NYE73245.1 riboflavin synthase [Microlunatus parietis]
MFTGIIEEQGAAVALLELEGAAQLRIRARQVLGGLKPGDSVAVNGACLTVIELHEDGFTVDVMPETLRRTTLGGVRPEQGLNLERAVVAGGRLDGHIVQGHVDGVGTIKSRTPGPRWDDVVITVPAELAKYVAEKGSVAVDGVSLTVTEVGDDSFGVSLIPTTLDVTTLGKLQPEVAVNLEVDVIAKYVERLLHQTERVGS